MNQGGQAGSEDDAAELPPLPVQQVRLWLSLIAYNLGNLWRRLALPRKIGNWSLTSLQQRLVKTGGRLVKHGAILLAFAGQRALEPEAVQQHAANDLGNAAARRLATQERGEFSCSEVVRRISVSGEVGWGGQNPHSHSEEQPK